MKSILCFYIENPWPCGESFDRCPTGKQTLGRDALSYLPTTLLPTELPICTPHYSQIIAPGWPTRTHIQWRKCSTRQHALAQQMHPSTAQTCRLKSEHAVVCMLGNMCTRSERAVSIAGHVYAIKVLMLNTGTQTNAWTQTNATELDSTYIASKQLTSAY